MELLPFEILSKPILVDLYISIMGVLEGMQFQDIVC